MPGSTLRIARRQAHPLQLVARSGFARSKRKFLRFFPGGFQDETYLDWERDYKWKAHERWNAVLNAQAFRQQIEQGDFAQVADHAVRIESRTNLLFSFEKMALRDALKSSTGARSFAVGLYNLLYSDGDLDARFEAWCETVAALPHRQSRVFTWPVVTVFGFIARPETHFFLKPMVMRRAAREYGFDFQYRPHPSWTTYSQLLRFAREVRRDLRDLRPRDMIDIQSFLWVLGSDEYDE
jgi:hypothetical protein